VKTEYHDPNLVETLTHAVLRSALEGRSYVVVRQAGFLRVGALEGRIGVLGTREAIVSTNEGTRWVINGFTCEEQRDGIAVRRCSFHPTAFACDWVDA
jgi:hypothetical protein